MNRSVLLALNVLVLSQLWLAPHVRGDDGKAVAIEPGDLTKRPDLVGREIVVDDRVGRFQYHRETETFDEIYLKRAPDFTFELPPRLRAKHSPQGVGVKIRGVLRHERERWWCDVLEVVTLPSDLDRLNSGVALLAKSDVDNRLSWARWAEARGREFADQPLMNRAREIEAEVIRVEAERPPGRDPSAHWLALAERARSHKIPEPEPSALAHRGFRAGLKTTQNAVELKKLLSRVESFFPSAAKARDKIVDLSLWEKPYANAPADAYRKSGADVREALDRRLWADIAQRWMEQRAVEEPGSLIGQADEAARLLPDRPVVASTLMEKGLATAAGDVGALRQSDVESLAKLYRDSLHQPEKSTALYRAWLDDQRLRRISPRDAEARIGLADQYESLLKDEETAISLLRDAWKIDPQSREVADAFRRRRYRKVNDQWVAPAVTTSPETAQLAKSAGDKTDPDPPAVAVAANPGRSDSLKNATPEEVRARMGGRPNKKVMVATQGQVIEQWIYFGTKHNQYVNILRKPGDTQARVVSYYSLPPTPTDTPANR